MFTKKQAQAIGNGYLEIIERDNDVDEYIRLQRSYRELQEQYSALSRKHEELLHWARDMEENFVQRLNEAIEEKIGDVDEEKQETTLTPEEIALKVDLQGKFIIGEKCWVNIATAAERKNVSYQTIWRAAKGMTQKAHIETMICGELSNGKDRIIVNINSWQRA